MSELNVRRSRRLHVIWCSILLLCVRYSERKPFFLKLAAAVAEPVGDARIASFLSSLSGTVNYFTAGLLAVGFMYFVTMLLLICSSNALF